MRTETWEDPNPARITFDEWGELFEQVPDELIARYHYFPPNEKQWSLYLFPPQTFAIYGCRHLRRLKFDNSLAALRLWGFVQNETERLFRARQSGRRVIATMGDLGAVPVVVNSFRELVAFYPDCLWWTPFVMESNVLLNAAAELGISEAACFSRAAAGAFVKHSYFPAPDLVIAATGASCDDYSGVEQLVADIVPEVLWVELPMRRDRGGGKWAYDVAGGSTGAGQQGWKDTKAGFCYETAARNLFVNELCRVKKRLEQLVGRQISEQELRAGVARVNRVRLLVAELRKLAYGSGALPSLEMMIVEFGNLHCYADIDEWTAILEALVATARRRKANGQRVLAEDALRLVWVTPPADPLLLCYVEDQGAQIVGTEYVINQALEPIDEEEEPLVGIADSFMRASLIGSTWSRAESVLRQIREQRAEGVIISGILGGSHCAMEARLIVEYVKEQSGLPVLEFDVAPPNRDVDRQLRTRIEAFFELLRERRQEASRITPGSVGTEHVVGTFETRRGRRKTI